MLLRAVPVHCAAVVEGRRCKERCQCIRRRGIADVVGCIRWQVECIDRQGRFSVGCGAARLQGKAARANQPATGQVQIFGCHGRRNSGGARRNIDGFARSADCAAIRIQRDCPQIDLSTANAIRVRVEHHIQQPEGRRDVGVQIDVIVGVQGQRCTTYVRGHGDGVAHRDIAKTRTCVQCLNSQIAESQSSSNLQTGHITTCCSNGVVGRVDQPCSVFAAGR